MKWQGKPNKFWVMYLFFCNMSPHYWVIGFQRFEVRYWSWPSKIRPGVCLEMLETNHPAMRRRTTEGSIPHPHRCLDLNTRKGILVRRLVFPHRNWARNLDSRTSKHERESHFATIFMIPVVGFPILWLYFLNYASKGRYCLFAQHNAVHTRFLTHLQHD
jgi:hypothetical protein